MELKKAYKFRIYPNQTQKQLFEKTFGCSRFLYNRALYEIKNSGSTFHKTTAIKEIPKLKKAFTWLKAVDSISLQAAIESLSVAKMLKNPDHAKSIVDVSWSEFTTMLKYKSEWYGSTIVEVGKIFPSSQLCSSCGHKEKNVKDERVRAWICPACNTNHDRDIHAARNIKKEAERLLSKSKSA